MIERLTASLDLEKDQVISIKNNNLYLLVLIVLRCFHCQASNQLSLDKPLPLSVFLTSKHLDFSLDNLKSLDKHRMSNCFHSCLAKKLNIPKT